MCVYAFFQNSTRDALHQRRSSNELNTAALASTRSASISVTGSGHVFPTKGDLKGNQPPHLCTLAPFPNAAAGVTSETAVAVTDIAENSKNAHIQELLSQSESWNMDIFALERLTDHRCLSNLGMKVINYHLVVCTWYKVIQLFLHLSTNARQILHK